MKCESTNFSTTYKKNKSVLSSKLGFLEGAWHGHGKIKNHKVTSLLKIQWQGQFLIWNSKSVSDELTFENSSSGPQIPQWKLETSEMIVFQGFWKEQIIHMHIRDKNKWDPLNLKFEELFLRLYLKQADKQLLFEPIDNNKFQKNFFIELHKGFEKIIFKNSNGTKLTYFRD